MPVPLTNEIVDQRLAGRPIVRLGEYVDCRIPMRWGCLAPGCGYEWETRFSNVDKGHGCRACAGFLPLTNEVVDQRLAARPLERVSDYVNNETLMLWRCLTTGCGHEWSATFSNVQRGNTCPSCSGHVPLTNEVVDQRLAARPLERVSDYVNAVTPMKWRCLVPGCGYEWTSSFGNIQKGTSCKACAGLLPLTNEIVDKRITGRPIKRLSGYVNNSTYMSWQCLVPGCGHKWTAIFSGITKGVGCPACADYGFNPGKPAIMYYVKIHGLYKIGVTNNAIKDRFGADDFNCLKVLRRWDFYTGRNALKREQKILKRFAADRYTGPPLLMRGGDTELFTRDILGLDVEIAA